MEMLKVPFRCPRLAQPGGCGEPGRPWTSSPPVPPRVSGRKPSFPAPNPSEAKWPGFQGRGGRSDLARKGSPRRGAAKEGAIPGGCSCWGPGNCSWVSEPAQSPTSQAPADLYPPPPPWGTTHPGAGPGGAGCSSLAILAWLGRFCGEETLPPSPASLAGITAPPHPEIRRGSFSARLAPGNARPAPRLW